MVAGLGDSPDKFVGFLVVTSLAGNDPGKGSARSCFKPRRVGLCYDLLAEVFHVLFELTGVGRTRSNSGKQGEAEGCNEEFHVVLSALVCRG